MRSGAHGKRWRRVVGSRRLLRLIFDLCGTKHNHLNAEPHSLLKHRQHAIYTQWHTIQVSLYVSARLTGLSSAGPAWWKAFGDGEQGWKQGWAELNMNEGRRLQTSKEGVALLLSSFTLHTVQMTLRAAARSAAISAADLPVGVRGGSGCEWVWALLLQLQLLLFVWWSRKNFKQPLTAIADGRNT